MQASMYQPPTGDAKSAYEKYNIKTGESQKYRKLAAFLAVPTIVLLLLFFIDPGFGESVVYPAIAGPKALKPLNLDDVIDELAGKIDYNQAVEKMRFEYPKETTSDARFFNVKLGDIQHRQCSLGVWMLVEQGYLSRPSAVASEPLCAEITSMYQQVDLSNLLMGGGLSWDQQETVKGILARGLRDAIEAGMRMDHERAPPTPMVPPAPVAPQAPPAPLAPPQPPTCENLSRVTHDYIVRNQYCMFSAENTAMSGPKDRGAVEPTLTEAVTASFLRAYAAHPLAGQSSIVPSGADGETTPAAMEIVGAHKCRIPIIGSTQARYPIFMAETAKALSLECDVPVFESNPKQLHAVEVALIKQGKRLPISTAMIEITNQFGSFTIQIPRAPGDKKAPHKHVNQFHGMVQVQTDDSGQEVRIMDEDFDTVVVNKTTLDSVLCEAVTAKQAGLMQNTMVPFCQLGEVPLVQIAAHASPSLVLDGMSGALIMRYPAAITWELFPEAASELPTQVAYLRQYQYSVYVAYKALPSEKRSLEPNLLQLDSDPDALQSVVAGMARYQTQAVVLAVRANHPFNGHAREVLLPCDPNCMAPAARRCSVPTHCSCLLGQEATCIASDEEWQNAADQSKEWVRQAESKVAEMQRQKVAQQQGAGGRKGKGKKGKRGRRLMDESEVDAQ